MAADSARAKVIFMGTPEFAVPSLSALVGEGHVIEMVVTQPDRPSGRRKAMKMSPVKEYAVAHDLPLIQPAGLRDTGVVNLLKQLDPDVIVVAAFGEILRRDLLALPKHGALNVHASLLPRYRGASPVSAAILAGERETGVTVMLMNEGLDTGDMLAQERTEIRAWDTQVSLSRRLSDLGAELLARTLPAWLIGQLCPLRQDAYHASYAGLVTKEAGRIDWNDSAMAIERKVRAYTPWPSAHTSWRERQLSILASGVRNESAHGRPGLVIGLEPVTLQLESGRSEHTGLAVATGDGVLVATHVQFAGGRPMPAGEFVRGHASIVGSTLGSEQS